MSPPGQLTGEFLRGWFALMDSAAPERVLELLADDFRFTVLFAKEDGAAEFGGGVEELRGYLAQREPDGQEHHIDLATSDGAREVVFGHTTRHGEPLATYTSVAELDADGRLRRLFSARTTALSFGDGP
jgi:ketosteroid isomerase-like protein